MVGQANIINHFAGVRMEDIRGEATPSNSFVVLDLLLFKLQEHICLKWYIKRASSIQNALFKN